MKTLKCSLLKKLVPGCIITLFLVAIPNLNVSAAMHTDLTSEDENHNEYTGIVVDRKTGTPLEFANFLVVGTNISIVSNKEGEFLLKIPKEISNAKVKVSYMGYKDMIIPMATLKTKYSRINMEALAMKLPELEVVSKDPYRLIQDVMDRITDNYMESKTLMKAFYRESVKNKHDYVSLAEAVVDVAKQPYYSFSSDYVKFKQVRKKTNYTESDTVSFKLIGGPNNCLKLDILKYPELIFTDNMLSKYNFSSGGVTFLDDKMIYILNFNHVPYQREALYSGKLYIDAQSLAIKTAEFSLDLSDKNVATSMIIKKRPPHTRIYPLTANYRVDYFEKDGKWYYGYSRIDMGFEVHNKKSNFYDKYMTTMEMAIFDWDKYKKENGFKHNERFKSYSAIENRVVGFSDPDFWGPYNIIEPDQSIQSAIEKIRSELEKQGLNIKDSEIRASK
jgi:hypothetical protein